MSATHSHNEIDNTTLTKEEQDDFLRRLLPACQPQEGSPANTFTQSELDDLKRALGMLNIGPSTPSDEDRSVQSFMRNNKVDIRNVQQAFNPPKKHEETTTESSSFNSQEGDGCHPADSKSSASCGLDWYGAPRLHEKVHLSRAFRDTVRSGKFTKPTNGVCPGFLQCNLVVLPQGPIAFDFLLFCQRNPKACPLIEVCDVGSPIPNGVAPGADLRTDVPRYVK